MTNFFNKLKKIYNKYTNWDSFDENWNNYYTGKKYDKNGYNMSWYDEDGYDRSWYNKKGYDRSWYNKSWWNEAWRNNKWINKETWNIYDKEGYDKDWYNKDWFDIKWWNKKWVNQETWNTYDKEWYNQEGFNTYWRNKEWINKRTWTKFDKYWYTKRWDHKKLYDREWYNVINGYHKGWFNSFWFDKCGYGREWYDINWYNRNWEYKYKKGEIKKITTKKPQTKNEKNKEIINDKKPIFKVFFFDTETTWTTPWKDYIIQFWWIFWELNFETREFKEIENINQFINVPVKIPEWASNVHWIYNKDLVWYWYINEYIDKFLSFFKECDYAIWHNVDFDRWMIRWEAQRLEIPFNFDSIKRVDTMKPCTELVWVRNSWWWCKRPKLIELHQFLFWKEFDWAHDAMADIRATKDCFIELCKNYNFYSNWKFRSNL